MKRKKVLLLVTVAILTIGLNTVTVEAVSYGPPFDLLWDDLWFAAPDSYHYYIFNGYNVRIFNNDPRLKHQYVQVGAGEEISFTSSKLIRLKADFEVVGYLRTYDNSEAHVSITISVGYESRYGWYPYWWWWDTTEGWICYDKEVNGAGSSLYISESISFLGPYRTVSAGAHRLFIAVHVHAHGGYFCWSGIHTTTPGRVVYTSLGYDVGH